MTTMWEALEETDKVAKKPELWKQGFIEGWLACTNETLRFLDADKEKRGRWRWPWSRR